MTSTSHERGTDPMQTVETPAAVVPGEDFEDELDDDLDEELTDEFDDEFHEDDGDDLDEDDSDDDFDEESEFPTTYEGAQALVEQTDQATVSRVSQRFQQYLEIAFSQEIPGRAKLWEAVKLSFAPEYRRGTGISLAVIMAVAVVFLLSSGAPVEGRNQDGTATPAGTPAEVTSGPDSTENTNGGQLNIPVDGTVPATAQSFGQVEVQPQPVARQHIVQQGENLFRIALRYGIPLDTLAAYNGIVNKDLITIGQVINIPQMVGQTPPQVGAPEMTVPQLVQQPDGLPRSTNIHEWGQMVGVNRYCLDQGDTLSEVARMFNVSVEQLQSWNGISDPNRVNMGTILQVGP